MSEKKPINFQLIIIWVTIFLDLMGLTLIIPFINEFVEQLGGDERHAGFLLGSYAVMQFIFAPVLGKISDKYGRKPVILFGLMGACIAFLIFGLANQLWLLFASRMLAGLSNANISVAQAYLADITPRVERAGKMGIIQAAFSLGFIVGFPIGGILAEHFSVAAPSLLASGLSLVNGIFALVLLPESLKPENRNSGPLKINPLSIAFHSVENILKYIRIKRYTSLLIIFLLYSFAFSILHVTFVEFNREYLIMNPQQIGFIFMYIGIVGFAVQMFAIKPLVKWVGEEKVMITGFLVMALGLAATPLTNHMNWLFLTSLLIAGGNSLLSPTATAIISQRSSEKEQGVILGISQSLGSLGRIFGPPYGALTYSMIHYLFPFISSAIILVGAVLYYLHSIKKRTR